MLNWGNVWLLLVVADTRFRHSDAVKTMLDAISEEFEDQGDKWDSNDAWRKLRVWSLATGEAIGTSTQVAQWRKKQKKKEKRTRKES